jgi:proteasome lid subunit RPN8/RPN11
MGRLVIPDELLDEMVSHARKSLPDEACGMLGGIAGQVRKLYALENSNPSPATYIIDPLDQLKTIKDMDSEGLELLGIYHSHPDSPPLPSITDINRAFFPGTRELNYPGVVYVIVGLSGPAPEVKAYRIEADGVVPVEIVRH